MLRIEEAEALVQKRVLRPLFPQKLSLVSIEWPHQNPHNREPQTAPATKSSYCEDAVVFFLL